MRYSTLSFRLSGFLLFCKSVFVVTLGLLISSFSNSAEACTRVVYLGPEDRILTGRSMDWKLPMLSNVWVFPRGIERTGVAGPRSVEWTSRYGSLIVTGYDISTVDGMNEEGLVVNLLWEVNATYPEDDGETPRISLAVFPQYLLDNYSSVSEALAGFRANPVHAVTGPLPIDPNRLATVHVSLSDASGDSAIIEFIDGQTVIHHGREYQVMTNEPTYEKQLAVLDYWEGVNPREFLPGTVRATDRFVRAHFYINSVVQSDDPRIAAASVFSVIRQTSVPWGISVENAPNLSTTRWRVVADQKERRYYLESVISPSVFWVDLDSLDFSEGASVKKLELGIDMERILSGEVSAKFEEAVAFQFEPAE